MERGNSRAKALIDDVDLPTEVKDDRWVWHLVACPHCRESVFRPAGPVHCENCERIFVVGSCAACGTVHVIKAAGDPFAANIPRCRNCERPSDAPALVRNWSVMLIGQAIAEVAAEVLKPERMIALPNGRSFETLFASSLNSHRTWSICLKRILRNAFVKNRRTPSPVALLTANVFSARMRFASRLRSPKPMVQSQALVGKCSCDLPQSSNSIRT